MSYLRKTAVGVTSVIMFTVAIVSCGGGSACADTVTAVNASGGGSSRPSGSSGSGSRPSGGSTGTRTPTAPRPATKTTSAPRVTTAPKATTRPPTTAPKSSQSTVRPPSRNANTRPPKTVKARKAGQAPGVKAPTKKTNFSTTYKTKVRVNGRNVNHVFVYHQPSYYDSAAFLALPMALRLADPYWGANYWNPYSMWYMHPVFMSSSCRPSEKPPAGEKPDQPPVNVVINNTTAPAETTTTTTTTTVPG